MKAENAMEQMNRLIKDDIKRRKRIQPYLLPFLLFADRRTFFRKTA